MIAFVNSEFVEAEKATLGITDLSIQRGYGIFDFFRTSNSIPLFLDNHLDRFYRSADSLRLAVSYQREELKNIINDLIRRNKIPESGIRLILTGGYSPDCYELSTPNLIIIQQPVQVSDKEKFDKGIKIILQEYMREFPLVKSINYLMGVYLQQELNRQKADDVLYFKDNNILEFPRSNVFAVSKEGTVITPGENVLPGITRMKVLELARKEYLVEERVVTVDELRNAAEVFLTSTTKRIIPVLTIDNITIGDGKPGKITTSLYNAFLEMEDNLLQVSIGF